ncbi:MAG: bifunctional diguanylate cyclase/phosphodiesterase [Dehalococcoidia bacterium]
MTWYLLPGLVVGFAVLAASFVAIARGARQQRRLRRALAMIESSTDLVTVATDDGRLEYLNDAGRAMLGIDAGDDLAHVRLAQHCADGRAAFLAATAFPQARDHGAWSGEIELRSRDGRQTPVSVVVTAHRSPASAEVEYYALMARDISERRQYEERIAFLANCDGLTGLFNRGRFTEEIQRELAQARRYGTHGALLVLDVDNFKGINDRLGHATGDLVLTAIAACCAASSARPTSSPACEDEFGVLLPQTNGAQAQATADRILDLIRREHFAPNGDHVRVTVSIGIALYPDHGTTVEDLFVNSERATRRAKEDGRERWRTYGPESADSVALGQQQAWEGLLREALARDGFFLALQPIMQLESGEVTQYEALLRLIGEDGKEIPPGSFLGIAERSGLIHEIDRWVVRKSVALIAERQRAGGRLSLEVNLSGKAFADVELLPLIQYELMRSRIDPAALTLEITETAAVSDLYQAQRFISTLKAWGCRFAIDDFGVGFSSFSYLKHLPVDYVKIDGSFVRNLVQDVVDQHLVRAMVAVAHGLGKQAIAEFVGDEATVAILKEIGVDFAQGYHIGRPRPAAEILAASPIRPPADRVAAGAADERAGRTAARRRSAGRS